MIKFITSNYGNEIEEQEITRETDKCYFIPGHRPTKEIRRVKDRHYHDTWENAHTYLLERSTRAVESAQSQLERAKNVLAKVKGMTRQG